MRPSLGYAMIQIHISVKLIVQMQVSPWENHHLAEKHIEPLLRIFDIF